MTGWGWGHYTTLCVFAYCTSLLGGSVIDMCILFKIFVVENSYAEILSRELARDPASISMLTLHRIHIHIHTHIYNTWIHTHPGDLGCISSAEKIKSLWRGHCNWVLITLVGLFLIVVVVINLCTFIYTQGFFGVWFTPDWLDSQTNAENLTRLLCESVWEGGRGDMILNIAHFMILYVHLQYFNMYTLSYNHYFATFIFWGEWVYKNN